MWMARRCNRRWLFEPWTKRRRTISRSPAFKGLAKNAKLFGNRLGQQVADSKRLSKPRRTWKSAPLPPRHMARFNLSSDQIKTLIIRESKP